VLPSRLSQWYANLASSRQLFWLVDLPLDVYLFYMVFHSNVPTVPIPEAVPSDEKQDGSGKDTGCKWLRSG